MSDQAAADRPDLGQTRTKPRAADLTGDPADPAPPEPETSTRPTAGRRMVPLTTAEPTVAVQYRLTERERDVLSRIQEARGDRRGIDTMRWIIATFGEEIASRAAQK